MFIRIQFDSEDSWDEWGREWDFVPAVGDVIYLSYEIPDEEPTGNYCLEVTVVRRTFYLDGDEICLTVIPRWPDFKVPPGYVANSPAWPSREVTRRESVRQQLRSLRPAGGGHE